MSPVRCTAAGCGERFGTCAQLDAHCALRHVGVAELRFACALCHGAFDTASQLVGHRRDKHKEVDGSAAPQSLYDALAAGGNGELQNGPGGDKENDMPAEKKGRYACKRCAYSTDHSAWLLHKHVIYEHLVEQTPVDGQFDDDMDVLPVPKGKRVCKRDFYAGSTASAAGGPVLRMGQGDGDAQLATAGPTVDTLHYGAVDGGIDEDAVQLFHTGSLDYTEPSYVQESASTSAPATVLYGGRGRRRGTATMREYKRCGRCPYSTPEPTRLRDHLRRVHGVGTAAAHRPYAPAADCTVRRRKRSVRHSSIWWYFEDHGIIDNSRVCVCLYEACGVTVKGACHTNLLSHIKRHHPVLHQDILDGKEPVGQFEANGGL